MFKIELHAHTSEVSSCSRLPARVLVDNCVAAGYHAVVVTDHFADYFVDSQGAMSWEEIVARFMAGYRAARDYGKLPVLLGMEYRNFETYNDYLVYGVTEEFLLAHPTLCHMPFAQFFTLCDKAGFLVYQAHPFRRDMSRMDPAFLHGAEVYNGNIRHNSNNDQAAAFADEHGLLRISGSDLHIPSDAVHCGILTEVEIRDNAALLSVLRSKKYALLP